MKWERVSGQLPDQAEVHESELIIPGITAADEGTYRCTARNAAGEVSHQVTVMVRGQRRSFVLYDSLLIMNTFIYTNAPHADTKIQMHKYKKYMYKVRVTLS